MDSGSVTLRLTLLFCTFILLSSPLVTHNANAVVDEEVNDLASELEELLLEAEQLAEVLDEAIVADITESKVVQLMEDVTDSQLDEDSTERLLSKLEHALDRIESAGDLVLELEEDEANDKLDGMADKLDSFMTRVLDLEGKALVEENVANDLISKAQEIVELEEIRGVNLISAIEDSENLEVSEDIILRAEDTIAEMSILDDVISLYNQVRWLI